MSTVYFLLGVIDVVSGSATADESNAIDAFNKRLKKDGRWVLAGGIAGPAESVSIDARGGEVVTQLGPVVSSEKFLAGFWIVTAADADEARALAVDASRACNREIEMRPILGLAD